MIAELVATVSLGALLLWLAVGGIGLAPASQAEIDDDAVEDTPRGRALVALRELEMDRETGKLSAEDYAVLKARLEWEALRRIKEEPTPPLG